MKKGSVGFVCEKRLNEASGDWAPTGALVAHWGMSSASEAFSQDQRRLHARRLSRGWRCPSGGRGFLGRLRTRGPLSRYVRTHGGAASALTKRGRPPGRVWGMRREAEEE